jgi:hypothetical protein
MDVREGGALLGEAACLLQDMGRLAEQHRMTGQTADEIAMAPMGHQLEDLGGGAMTVAAAQDMGLGPGAPHRGQEPDEDQRMLGARGTLAWPEAGGHHGVWGAFEKEERQIAMVLIVMSIACTRLLAMRRVIGVIEVKHNGGGRLGGAGDAVVD